MEMDRELKELIVERLFLDINPEEIDTDTPLAEYGVDSFLLLELIVAIEEMFDIKFEQTDITSENLQSVRTMMNLIEQKKTAG